MLCALQRWGPAVNIDLIIDLGTLERNTSADSDQQETYIYLNVCNEDRKTAVTGKRYALEIRKTKLSLVKSYLPALPAHFSNGAQKQKAMRAGKVEGSPSY